MKKSLSVILSLVLLVSSLAIPMTVSADGTLTADEAYAQLNAAVDGLELDLDNIQLTQIANPDRSITAKSNYPDDVSSVSDVSDESLTSILGSKSVKILANSPTTGTTTGLIPGHVHAVEYALTSDTNRILARDIGYIVLYVKTNRSFKMSLGVHDNSTGSPNIINGDKAVSVSANADEYQAVAFNLTSVDWVNGNGVYLSGNNNNTSAANRMYLSTQGVKWYFPSIQEMTDDNGDIATTEDIVFGSIFYVPVDTNVRKFKFNYDTTNQKILPSFPQLSGDMIAAAEMITNDGGRYTDESFAELQTAIVNAKASFLASADIFGIKALLSSELANAGTVEEIWRPTFNYDPTIVTDNNNKKWVASTNVIEDSAISKYRLLFGEYAAKQDSTHTKVSFVKEGVANANGDSVPTDLSVYDDVWLYAYNNSSAPITPSAFSVVTTNSITLSLQTQKLSAGINRIELFGAKPIGDSIDINSTNYATFKDIVKDTNINNAAWNTNRFQINHNTFADGASVIYGTIFGLRALDKTELDNANSLVKIVDFYDNYIKDKGLSNVENATITFETLKSRFTSVRTVAFNDDTTVNSTGDYTLDKSNEGQHVSYTL